MGIFLIPMNQITRRKTNLKLNVEEENKRKCLFYFMLSKQNTTTKDGTVV